ncbi:MAG TPA: hypothetical protein DCW45_07320 [Opitutae bacterium]|nr:hypothetical protein [Opitutae bacterium]
MIAGKEYREVYHRGDWFDQASREEILAYQERALGRLLRHATMEVPAYFFLRSVVEKFNPLEALSAFPFLEKEELQKDPDRYLSRNLDQTPCYETTTGGTSGNQLRFHLDDHSQSMETGFMHRQWKRVKYKAKDKKVVFRGVSFDNLKPNVFWQENPIYNEIQFSPFHMSDANLESYLIEFIRYQPKFVHGYPSAVEIFADYILRNDKTKLIPKVQAVLLGSEGTTDQQRRIIERGLGARVFSWYGLSERVALGGECEKNSSYHLMPDYGYVEIIKEDGSLCYEEGDEGEIVGTNLFNFSMPFIRYKTGDWAKRLSAECECGRNWDRITEVKGRWKKEFVVGSSGAKISTAALNMHGDLFNSVQRFQYFQDKPGEMVIKILPKKEFSNGSQELIESAYKKKVGDELQVKIRIVDDIPLTKRGKVKMLDSRI